MSTLVDKRPAPHPDAAIEEVDGRLMVATPDDRLHSFVEEDGETPSEVGERIMRLSDGSRTVGEIARVIASEFEGADLEVVEKDTLEFVQRLADKGVLVLKD